MIEATLFPSRFVRASSAAALAEASTHAREEIPRGGRRSVAVMGDLARRVVGGVKVGSALPGVPPIEAAPPAARPRPSLPPGTVPGSGDVPEAGPPGVSPPGAPAPPTWSSPVPALPTRTWPVSFHFTDAIAGGSATSELRVYGPVPAPYRIKSVVVSPLAAVSAGQFIDVLTSADGNTTDTATPTGQSLFDPVLPGGIPSPDASRGLAVPVTAVAFNVLAAIPVENQFIKVLLSFAAPAVALPDVSVTLVLEQFSGAAPTIDERPPAPEPRVLAAPEPPYVPPAPAPAPIAPTTPYVSPLAGTTSRVRNVTLSNGRTIPVLVPTSVAPAYRTQWARAAAAGQTALALYRL
jgi:hypothetical protein